MAATSSGWGGERVQEDIRRRSVGFGPSAESPSWMTCASNEYTTVNGRHLQQARASRHKTQPRRKERRPRSLCRLAVWKRQTDALVEKKQQIGVESSHCSRRRVCMHPTQSKHAPRIGHTPKRRRQGKAYPSRWASHTRTRAPQSVSPYSNSSSLHQLFKGTTTAPWLDTCLYNNNNSNGVDRPSSQDRKTYSFLHRR